MGATGEGGKAEGRVEDMGEIRVVAGTARVMLVVMRAVVAMAVVVTEDVASAVAETVGAESSPHGTAPPSQSSTHGPTVKRQKSDRPEAP